MARKLMRISPQLPVLLLLASAAPLLAQKAASVEEVRAAMAAGDYRGAVTQIDKQLFPTSKDTAGRFELLMLKGECRLQLQDRLGAASAFKSAAKIASNPSELAAARANAIIIERSTSGRYTPRFTTGAEPIDILPIDSRKRAMLALEAEMGSQYKSQIDSALRADQLPPIEQVFPRVAEMFFLESFAAAQPSETGKLMQDLGGHAFKLMQDELNKCSSRIDYLNQLANSASDNARGWNSGRLGLTSQQRDEIRAMLPYLNKLRERATEYRGIAAQMGGNENKWDALVADAVDAIADAESLYNDR